MSGINNTNYGEGALQSNTSGNNNNAFGAYSLYLNSTGNNNVAEGANTLFYNITGNNNTALGSGAICNNTVGSNNTAIGSSALEGIVGQSVGDGNVAVGSQSLYNNEGSYNTSVGIFSGLNHNNGTYNTFLGANSDVDISSNNYQYSTAVGYGAKITGSNQIMLGGTGPSGYPNVVVRGNISNSGGFTGSTGTFQYLQGVTGTYYNGITSNIQQQLNAIDTTITDISYSNDVTKIYNYFQCAWNSNGDLIPSSEIPPSGFNSNFNGYIAGNLSDGNAEFDFVNSYYDLSANNLIAFSFYKHTSDSSANLIAYMKNSGLINYENYLPGSFDDNTLVPKQYVDTFASGISVKESVYVATTPNTTYSGWTYDLSNNITGVGSSLTIDGVALDASSNVLVKDFVSQPKSYGTYRYDASNNLTRSADMTYGTVLDPAAFVFVQTGTVNALTSWVSSPLPATIGVTDISFNQFSSSAYKLGNGLQLSSIGGNNYLNVKNNLNFINSLDSVVGPTGASGTLSIGANTSNLVIGTTGGSYIQCTSGITGPTGSFQYLQGVTGTYYNGITSNIQQQLNAIDTTITDLSFNIDVTKIYNYFQCAWNSNGVLIPSSEIPPSGFNSNFNGYIAGNLSDGNAEFDFVNSSYDLSANNLIAFSFYKHTSDSSANLIAYIDNGGNITATSYNATSDYRVKENILSLDDTDFSVDNLHPVSYINKKTAQFGTGFIAHEIQQHFPHLVQGEKDGEQLQSVNYIGLIAILVKEFQTLKKEVSELRRLIAEKKD